MQASEISGGAGKAPHFPYMRITGAGLMLGRGVLLAKMDEEGLCIDEDSILILLAIAQRRELQQTVIPAVGRAAKHWRSGDKALAAICLAQIGLRKIDEEDAESLRLAAGLLDAGMSPRELARELGLNIQFRARKYEDFNRACRRETAAPADNGPPMARRAEMQARLWSRGGREAPNGQSQRFMVFQKMRSS